MLVSLATVAALAGCTGHDTKSAASQKPLDACEVRQVHYGNVAGSVTANADGTLAHFDPTSGTKEQRDAASQQVYQDFGQPQLDTKVRPIQNKWGLTAWLDRCGRASNPQFK
jgi:hypothetical protein